MPDAINYEFEFTANQCNSLSVGKNQTAIRKNQTEGMIRVQRSRASRTAPTRVGISKGFVRNLASPRALAHLLGGEVGIENSPVILGRDALSGIAHAQPDKIPGVEIRLKGRLFPAEVNRVQGNLQGPDLVHGVSRVGTQIHEDLLDLGVVNFDPGQRIGYGLPEFNRRRNDGIFPRIP